MLLFPNAKINLGLDITARRADGYHDIATAFYPIPLTDVLELVPAHGEQATLTCYGRPVDCPPEKNLVMKAYRLLHDEFPRDVYPVDIYLYKHIPDGAGLGGGSSDASHTLLALNAMFGLGLSREQLAQRASKLGADCAFFIFNEAVMATGIGDVFTPLPSLSLQGLTLLLVKPDVSVPTREAYAQVTPAPSPRPIPSILAQPLAQWRGELKNDFEPSVFAQHPQVGAIKQALYRAGAIYASMSGSGSSVFGIFQSDILADQAARQFPAGTHYVMQL